MTDENNRLHTHSILIDIYICAIKQLWKYTFFVLNMHYAHLGYQSSICDKNCAYCNQIFRVCKTIKIYCGVTYWLWFPKFTASAVVCVFKSLETWWFFATNLYYNYDTMTNGKMGLHFIFFHC